MTSKRGLTRRDLIGAAGALGAFTAGTASTGAAGPPGAATMPLPRRTDFVIRHAWVLSMDPAIGNLADGDVHVRDGAIVAVGRGLRAPGATAIDGRDSIVMPGMIDGHNHLWNTPERNLVRESSPGKGYFPTTLALGKQYTATDTYRGVLLGVAELLFSGVTTVNDWSHNLRTPAYAEADLRALRDAGIRARFSYGTYQGGPPPDQPMDTTHLEVLARDWKMHANEGLITLGMASRSISNSPRGAVTVGLLHRDWDVARRLGIPITIHVSAGGLITTLDREGLLGSDVQLVHPVGWTPAELDTVARTKATACTAPTTDVRLSYGLAPLAEFFKRNIVVSTSLDTAGVTGYNNLFEEMRILYADQCALAKSSAGITPQQILEIVTINGARDLGIADRVGSLAPGKRADLILVRTNDLNMAPLGDPVEAIVRSALPHNVDTVVVDGRILKRAGRLTAIDAAQVAADAANTLAALKSRTGLA